MGHFSALFQTLFLFHFLLLIHCFQLSIYAIKVFSVSLFPLVRVCSPNEANLVRFSSLVFFQFPSDWHWNENVISCAVPEEEFLANLFEERKGELKAIRKQETTRANQVSFEHKHQRGRLD